MIAEAKLTPQGCPRFQTCNAAVCPLDLTDGVHLWGEPVCYYLRCSGKAGAAERFADDRVFAACLERLPEVVAKYPDIGRTVERASKSGFGDHNAANLRKKRTKGVCAVET